MEDEPPSSSDPPPAKSELQREFERYVGVASNPGWTRTTNNFLGSVTDIITGTWKFGGIYTARYVRTYDVVTHELLAEWIDISNGLRIIHAKNVDAFLMELAKYPELKNCLSARDLETMADT